MPPIALALIDTVLALALHHDRRAREAGAGGPSVRAEIAGPEHGGHFPGAFVVRVTIRSPAAEPREESRELRIDLDEERLLAPDFALAELTLSRGGLARIVGELEAWCYEQIPVAPTKAEAKAEDDP